MGPAAGDARRLLRRIGGAVYETFVADLLARPLGDCLDGIRESYFAPTPVVIERLEAFAGDWDTPCEDEVRIELWRALVGLAPERAA